MSGRDCVIGVDFGTDSVRSLIAGAGDGEILASAVAPYRRWQQGAWCDPAASMFRQHPQDHLDGLEAAVRHSLLQVPDRLTANIRAISLDTTGSTPGPVDKAGNPLALTKGFEENPNAMFVLWKDHSAIREADEINQRAHGWGGVDFTRYSGGIYSPEWFWAKMLHILRMDPAVRQAAFSWVEHCDWITAELTGKTDPLTIKRSRCAAGHKAMWHKRFDGLPAEDFLSSLDPLLAGMRSRLYTDTWTSDMRAGGLCSKWAGRLGLPEGIPIGVAALDAHMGAVGAGIRPRSLVKVVGTSTCDMLVAPADDKSMDDQVRGICGQVDGSILPDMLGMEAGQSAFGDVYAWYRDVLLWPIRNLLRDTAASTVGMSGDALDTLPDALADRLIPALSHHAAQVPVERSGIVALDWLNGRRTPDANLGAKGALTGLTLGSDAPRIFRALVEATAFGSRRIVDRFVEAGLEIDEVIALGGVAKRSTFAMQVMADVLNMNINVSAADEACALGSAMYASVVAGLHDSIDAAQQAMGRGFEKIYRPDAGRAKDYDQLYRRYIRLGEFVERVN